MRRVVIESPFRPPSGGVHPYSEMETLRQNIVYARLALLDCLKRGEYPSASHLTFTQVWAETPELREAGIRAGLEAYRWSDAGVHYVDLGVSEGMQRALKRSHEMGMDVEERRLFGLSVDVRAELALRGLPCFPALNEGHPVLFQDGVNVDSLRARSIEAAVLKVAESLDHASGNPMGDASGERTLKWAAEKVQAILLPAPMSGKIDR